MAAIEAEMQALAARRGPGKTFCPSEVARSLGGEDWRAMMPEIRRIGAQLVRDGALICTQKGKPIDPETARGPIRFGPAP